MTDFDPARLLVVDDEATILQLLSGSLRLAGFEVTTAASGAEAVRAATLAKGMRVIVWPVRNIPNIALYNWVRAGSRNEAPGATGLAHFFEHMMFNGTSRHPPGEFDRLMEAEGGEIGRAHV